MYWNLRTPCRTPSKNGGRPRARVTCGPNSKFASARSLTSDRRSPSSFAHPGVPRFLHASRHRRKWNLFIPTLRFFGPRRENPTRTPPCTHYGFSVRTTPPKMTDNTRNEQGKRNRQGRWLEGTLSCRVSRVAATLTSLKRLYVVYICKP